MPASPPATPASPTTSSPATAFCWPMAPSNWWRWKVTAPGVVAGGPIGDHKGINLPGVQVSIPSLTEKDLADLHFGLTAGVDMIALSFVRTAGDVRGLRDRLGPRPITIVAKIEKPEAWDNIESILDSTDGVMVARGDLGVEISLERVPRIQKSIIRRARRKGRFVITATQMLESMISNATPTRAEVSDVANAIY